MWTIFDPLISVAVNYVDFLAGYCDANLCMMLSLKLNIAVMMPMQIKRFSYYRTGRVVDSLYAQLNFLLFLFNFLLISWLKLKYIASSAHG